MAEVLDIGVVAVTSGLAPFALRFYEQEGLIRRAGRDGLRRQYDPQTLERPAFIVMCRDAGFQPGRDRPAVGDPCPPGVQGHRPAQARRAPTQIEHAQLVAERLEHALRCPSPNVFDCEHFQSAVSAVSAVFGAAGTDSDSVTDRGGYSSNAAARSGT
jgi:DNA-binding transcriptional MerR regulator